MRFWHFGAAAAALFLSGPAQALEITWDFGRDNGNGTKVSPSEPVSSGFQFYDPSATFTQSGHAVTATAQLYSPFPIASDPNPIAGTSFSDSLLSRTKEGIGVCHDGETDGQCRQVGTNSANEVIRLQFTQAWKPVSILVNKADSDDTIAVYGLTDDSDTVADLLTPHGDIAGIGSPSGGDIEIDFDAGMPAYEILLITTDLRGSARRVPPQAFRVDQFVGQIPDEIPEPGSLALLLSGLAGLTLVPVSTRRRRR